MMAGLIGGSAITIGPQEPSAHKPATAHCMMVWQAASKRLSVQPHKLQLCNLNRKPHKRAGSNAKSKRRRVVARRSAKDNGSKIFYSPVFLKRRTRGQALDVRSQCA